MKFKLDADVPDQSRDMPVLTLTKAEEKAVFHYEQDCANACKFQRTAFMRHVRAATLDHPDLLFTHNSKIISGIGSRVRMSFLFNTDTPFEQVISNELQGYYGKRSLYAIYNIWISGDKMTASFAPIDDLYRNKVRNYFIDSFINRL